MTKINPDALKRSLQIIADTLPPANPPHGDLAVALAETFSEDDPAPAPAETQAESKPFDPAAPKPAPDTFPGPGAGGTDPAAAGVQDTPPSDPLERRNWLQRELDRLQGK